MNGSRLLAVSSALVAAALASPGHAVTVLGKASIYQVFGHSGSTNGGATDAVLLSGSVTGGEVFTILASGEIGCCSYPGPSYQPDGANGNSGISAYNGLSGISGNSIVPLVAVFTSETDPFGSPAPASSVFDRNSPTSLSPLLNQVFYIGDGRSGYNDPLGAALAFTAPTGATRLYVGIIDSHGFNGSPNDYGDNPGSFEVSWSSVAPAVPEPASWAMMVAGLGAIGFAMRRRSRAQVAFAGA